LFPDYYLSSLHFVGWLGVMLSLTISLTSGIPESGQMLLKNDFILATSNKKLGSSRPHDSNSYAPIFVSNFYNYQPSIYWSLFYLTLMPIS
jgi:hypothetical protein